VLGCGHTGTTLISGILHINGYGSFSVSQLFENTRLNDLNRRILDGTDVAETEIEDFLADVERRTHGRWSLKDPRLSETVGRFYHYIREPVGIIFNFRHPGATVRTLIKERETYESNLSPEQRQRDSEDEWLRRNRAVLNFLDHENDSQLLMVRYDDLVDGALDASLCRFLGRAVDTSFADPAKRHSEPMAVRPELLDLYDELNRRFEANREEVQRTTGPVEARSRRGRTARTSIYVAANGLINDIRLRMDRMSGGGRP
jgi:hypothetical protein